MSDRYLQIDSEGYISSDGVRWTDTHVGQEILRNVYLENRVYKSKYEDREIFLEVFDLPLVVSMVAKPQPDLVQLQFPYEYVVNLPAARFARSLSLDEWDRFHGRLENGAPFVFSNKAQAALFDLFDEFDDESVTLNGQQFEIGPWFQSLPDVQTAQYWTGRYETWKQSGDKPGWDLQGPAPALVQAIPQLKVPKSSVAVLGAGAGHDAAYLASLGHVVTAFDISEEAVARAKQKYPETENLKYVVGDILKVPARFVSQFDMVFEHTFFCAIDPVKRVEAVKAYRQLLHEEGHLLGVFFAITNEGGPPFGATEWELRKRLEKGFEFLYWTRWRHSPAGRKAWEFLIYGKKKAGI